MGRNKELTLMTGGAVVKIFMVINANWEQVDSSICHVFSKKQADTKLQGHPTAASVKQYLLGRPI